MIKIKRALISVSDKSGLEGLVRTLNKFGVEIISTGGTSKAIAALGVSVKDVSAYTGFPEMLDGRVKTLHPKIHGGLLAVRDSADHMEAIKRHDISLIDMVVVNLYPFERTVASADTKLEEAIENIDIGGPSMLRSAAKNYKSVCVVCDTADYGKVIADMENSSGCITESLASELGMKVFRRTSDYDSAIYNYLSSRSAVEDSSSGDFPKTLSLKFSKIQDLRYGENPHQKAAFYRDLSTDEPGLADAVQLGGKELSFNNIIDLNAALEIVREFESPAAVIIKHTNPCGAAVSSTLKDAYLAALDCDRMSAFGGIVGFNRPVDTLVAGTILEEADFVECIIAPRFDREALELLKKKKNLRLIELKDMNACLPTASRDIKRVIGGLLVQSRDIAVLKEEDLKIVTKARPTEADIRSMLFGWTIAKHVKSNAIVICEGTRTVGVGAGQMSRVDSVAIAAQKAGGRSNGATLASDAFFPKEDGIEAAARAGITSIIQPGGSVKDADVIRKADELGIAMVFTGVRHFKH